MRYLPVLAYAACIVAANLAIVARPEGVPVGFGLTAPAGVYFAGLVFACRNVTQQTLGRAWGYGAIAAGVLASAALSAHVTLPGGLAPLWLASAVAFGLSETADALVWTPAREHGWWTRAMGAGELAGQFVDSAVFLVLALGSLDFLLGQVVGKYWTVLPAMAALAWWGARRGVPETA